MRRLIRRVFVALMRWIDRASRRSGETSDTSAARKAELMANLSRLHCATDGERGYLQRHGERMAETIALVERASTDRGVALELGSYLHMAWMLETTLGYKQVYCAGFGEPGIQIAKSISLNDGRAYSKTADLFDVERDTFPYEDGSIDLVLACELIEHLHRDPLRMLREINRVLRVGGVLVLTTPNCSSLGSLANILYQVNNPYVYSLYPPADSRESGHIREFVPAEIRVLLAHAGFTPEEEFTRYLDNSQETHAAIRAMLDAWGLPADMRGELYFVAARKSPRSPSAGYPASLYDTQGSA